MNWKNVLIIYKKEVLSFFKNKEALLVMLLVPLIIYPGIMLLTGDLFAGQLSRKASLQLEIIDLSSSQTIDQNLLDFQKYLQTEYLDDIAFKKVSFSIKVQNPQKSTTIPKLTDKNKIIISFKKPEESTSKKFGDIKIYYDSRNDITSLAVHRIQSTIETYNASLLKLAFTENNLSQDLLNRIHIEEVKNIAPQSHSLVKIGGGMIAITLMFLVYISCQYAATEVLPAEREQNTLETLLATPIEWKEIIIGKYFAIVSAGILNACSNLAGIVLFGGSIIASIDKNNYSSGLLEFNPLKVFILLLTLIPLAFMCGSLALLLVSFAKTRMAASYYSLPGMLLVSIPAAISLLPNTELKGLWYLIPFANITLYFRNLFLGDFTALSTIIIFINIIGFSFLLSVCSIYISHRKDQILAGGTNLTLFFRPKSEKNSLSTQEGVFIVIISFILFLTIGMALQSKLKPWSINLSFWGLLFIPSLLYMKFKRVNPQKFLKLYIPTITQTIGVLTSLIPMILIALVFNFVYSQITSDNKQTSQLVQNLIMNFKNEYGLFLCIFLFAITPGIVEEFIFRGVLFASLRNKYSWVAVVIITGTIFAFIHGVNRAIPILPIGFFLGWLRYRTQSIFNVILFHICFNALNILLSVYLLEAKPAFDKIETSITNNQTVIGIAAFIIIPLLSIISYKCITSSQHKHHNPNEI